MTWRFVLPALLGLAAGCSDSRSSKSDAKSEMAKSAPAHAPSSDPQAKFYSSEAPSSPPAGAAATGAAAAKASVPAVPRKIIYTAEIGLVVEKLAALESQLPGLIKSQGGYILNSKVNVNQGSRRSGTWSVKVPVERFHETLDALAKLGSPEKRNIDSQDVTEEFVDIEARVANKKGLEQRVLALLEKRSGDINEVLRLEGELNRIREEIERMQGRLKYLASMSALSTITITAREPDTYTAPPPSAPPELSDQIGSVWDRSVASLAAAGKLVLLAAVAAAPWVPVIAAGAFLLYVLARRRTQARKRRAWEADAESPPPGPGSDGPRTP